MKFIQRNGGILWGDSVEVIFRDDAPAYLGRDGTSCWYISGREYEQQSERRDPLFPVIMPPEGGRCSRLTRKSIEEVQTRLEERRARRS